MQLLGVDVLAVPTILLSNDPHYPTSHGGPLEADLLRGLLTGLREREVLRSCRYLLSGYFGTAANADVVADFAAEAKAGNPRLLYCCDPVMGDVDRGFFVDKDLPDLFRERLLGLADLITPNQFEFEFLVGSPMRTIKDMAGGVDELRRRGARDVVVTGAQLAETPPGSLDVVAFQDANIWRVTTPRLPIRPSGTGDLFTGVLVGCLVRGGALHESLAHAASATYAVLEDTMRAHACEMRIVRAAPRIVQPRRQFEAKMVRPE
jgi:pyridoxine kinase